MKKNSLTLNKKKETKTGNSTKKTLFPAGKTIHQVFEDQVKKAPNKTALIFENSKMTYNTLNARANQVACYIRKLYRKINKTKLKPDTLIGIFTERSFESVIGILGILKSGEAYVPIDPKYPQERINFIIKDANIKLILTQDSLAAIINNNKKFKCKTLIINNNSKILEQPTENPVPINKYKDLSYIIYTSGSTGIPKGVLQIHWNVLRLFNSSNPYFNFNNRDVWPLFHSVSFDFSVWEIWGALLFGGTLLILSHDQTRNSIKFYELLNKYKVTVLNQTPSAFSMLQKLDEGKTEKLNYLRYVIFGGERLNFFKLEKWIKKYGCDTPELINMYGITETTVHVTYKKISKEDLLSTSSNIGTPLYDLKVFILDSQFNELPAGEAGELYVGGDGLARGYLNRPELTKERFIKNPFINKIEKKTNQNLRLYKTGDIVRKLPDGNLEYIGRNDRQIQLKGFRIELDEIETVITKYSKIDQSVVKVFQHNDNNFLIAYYSIKKDNDSVENKLRKYLSSRLPDYMIPSQFIKITFFPITTNGKIDFDALPKPVFKERNDTYIPPKNKIEKELIHIWEEVLGLSKIGTKDNFFSRGGDSILCIQVIAKANSKGIFLETTDLYNHPTISQLAQKTISSEKKLIIHDLTSEDFHLSPIQNWFFEQNFEDFNYWNQSQLIIVPYIEYQRFHNALNNLICYHDSFRLRYKKKGNNYIQYYCKNIFLKEIHKKDISNELYQISTIKNTCAAWENFLDIENGPLITAGIITGHNDGMVRVFISAHHLIIDGISWRILLEDLQKLYEGKELPEKTNSFKDWQKALVEYSQKIDLQIHLQYWNKVNDKIDNFKIPFDFKTTEKDLTFNTEKAEFELNQLNTVKLLKNCSYPYNTQINDLLISAFCLSLSLWSNNSYVAFKLEGHGRENCINNINITRTIGWFTSLFPVCIEIEKKGTIESLIKQVKEHLRIIPDKGLSYGILRYLHPYSKVREGFDTSYPTITFNYLGQFNKNDKQINNWQLYNTMTGHDSYSKKNHSSNLIEFNSSVVNNTLTIRVTYSTDHFKKATIESLGNLYITKLIDIIKHCTNNGKRYFTPSDFPLIELTQNELDKIQHKYNEEIESIYPLTNLQKGLLFHALHSPASDQYSVQLAWNYNCKINSHALKKAWEKIISTHKVLRSFFIWDTKEPLQCITKKETNIPWKEYDLSPLSHKKQKKRINDICLKDRAKKYSLQSPKMMRFKLIKKAEDKYTFVWSNHHIIIDGWSCSLIQSQVNEIYLRLTEMKDNIEIPYYQYTHYIEHLYKMEKNPIIEFWKNELKHLTFPTDLPIKKTGYKLNPNIPIRIQKSQCLIFSKKRTDSIQRFVNNLQITISTLIQCAWGKVLNSYTDENYTIFGTVFSGRAYNLPNIDKMVGLFINTLPVIINWSKKQTVKELLKYIQIKLQQINNNSNISITEIQKLSNIKDKYLFNNIYIYEKYPEANITDTSLKTTNFKEMEKTNYPISIINYLKKGKLVFKLKYNAEIFDDFSIKNLLNHLKQTILSFSLNPDSYVNDISILSPTEYAAIIYDQRTKGTQLSTDKTIYQLFEKQVVKTPNNTALLFEQREMSYRELNEISNQLARYIRKQYRNITGTELKRDTLIGICSERSIEMIIGILGILKSGAAYVPISPELPINRLDYIIEDTNIKLLLTQKHLIRKLKRLYTNVEKIILNSEIFSKENKNNLKRISNQKSLAYCIYTSGTTGFPKGVLIENNSILNTINFLAPIYLNHGKNKRSTFYTSYSFDVSVSEIFTPLLNGMELYIFPEKLRKLPEEAALFIKENNINISYFPPAFLSLLPLDEYKSLNTLIYAGEPCTIKTAKKWSSSKKLFNLFGPTEAAVYCIGKKIDYDEVNIIGKPIPNTKVYILNNNLKPVPVGVPGELYIGGAGLARGYLNNTELTQKHFVNNPFSTAKDIKKRNTKLYKTGDVCRYLEDGNIEYIGRNDLQVKIRGFRIELREIENVLLKHNLIEKAVVKVINKQLPSNSNDNNEHKYLAAYYKRTEKGLKQNFGEEEFKKFLAKNIPEYMIPSFFIELDKFPLNTSGKIDRKALPLPKANNTSNITLPTNQLQENIRKAWSETLGIPENNISIMDNFFSLGGNSILTIQLYAKLKNNLHLHKIEIADLFTYKNIHSLSKYLISNREIDIQQLNIKKTKKKVETDIAIIGCSAAFSGTSNIDEYWQLILDKKEGFTKSQETVIDEPNFIPVIGKITGIKEFDTAFWDIAPQEAKLTDPQIRKFLEHCWYVLEQTGYTTNNTEHNIGVFAGSADPVYLLNNILKSDFAENIDMWSTVQMNGKDFLATKASYHLGLTGPAININTGCSTSLVAITEACKNISSGTCNMAIAGGVSLNLPEDKGYFWKEGMIMSKNGHCKPFDSEASGIFSGSGIGILLLKQLSDAQRDNDFIYGIIKGYATNNDGSRKPFYTAPSANGQSECIIKAQKLAGLSSDKIDYIECHGTGTKLGDPIEVSALTTAFKLNQDKPRKDKCVIGSVKANIGHANTAAGVAGAIKVLKMIENKIIPGQANFITPNSKINLAQTPFKVITEKQTWQTDSKPFRAGISSFGIGGTNAHIIIEEYNKTIYNASLSTIEKIQPNKNKYILPLSAKSKESLTEYKSAFLDYLLKNINNKSLHLENIAYTLEKKRKTFKHRSYLYGASIYELIELLQQNKTGYFFNNNDTPPKLIFVFPGQGSQYPNMGLDLYLKNHVFRTHIDDCIRIIDRLSTNRNFKQIMYPALYSIDKIEAEKKITLTQYAQPAIFITSFALSKYLQKYNITPSIYFGHSIGEYTAAVLAGVFSLEDAIKAVWERGQLMGSMPKGCMLAVYSKKDSIKPFLKRSLEISVYNTPDLIVVSGNNADIDNLSYTLEQENVSSSKLHTSHAFHSEMMEQAARKYKIFMQTIHKSKPSCPFISNITGKMITDEQTTSSQYWADQIRKPVQFSKGIIFLQNKYPNSIFVEVGTGSTLTSFIKQHKQNNTEEKYCISTLPSMKEQNTTESFNIYDIRSKLWGYGLNIPLNKYNKEKQISHINTLPLYQFAKTEYWISPNEKNKTTDKELSLNHKMEDWIYTPRWERLYKLKTQKNFEFSSNNGYIIFIDENSPMLDNILQNMPLTNRLLVYKDYSIKKEAFYDSIKGIFRINPLNEHNYKTLAIIANSLPVKCIEILHLWNINTKKQPDISLRKQQYEGFISAYLIQQNIFNSQQEFNFMVISNNSFQVTGEDNLNIGKSSLHAALKVIMHESLNVSVMYLDIDTDNIDISIILPLMKELKISQSSTLDVNALRNNFIWQQKITKVKLDDNNFEPALENNDIVLITGGTGGAGLSTALQLSQTRKLKFILVNRHDLADNENDSYREFQINHLKQITENGSTYQIFPADISKESHVENLIVKVLKQCGKLDVIIHTAGTLPLKNKERTIQKIEESIASKIYGTEHLLKYTSNLEIKVFIMISSLAAIMGDVGRIEYCAANAFLDCVSQKSWTNIRNIISVNLPELKELGMSLRYDNSLSKSKTQSNDIIRDNNLTEDNFKQLINKLFCQNLYNQVIISKLPIYRFEKYLFAERKSKPVNKNIIIEKNITDNERVFADIFCETLGINKISILENFFNIGGNSILAIQMCFKIRKLFDISFSVTDILQNPTVKKLANLKTNLLENNIIKELNKIEKGKDSIFLIHPAGGGCEVYNNICHKLCSCYNCIGVDNYNINSRIKISSLSSLSELYSKQIKQSKYFNKNRIIILGWSLGGIIALSIATQMEKEGLENINIFLLDSFMYDEQITKIRNEAANSEDNCYKLIEKDMLKQGYSRNYIIEAMRTHKAEDSISQGTIPLLEKSKIFLFKATEPDLSSNLGEMKEVNKHILAIPDNNLKKISHNLKVFSLPCHHGNILEHDKKIIDIVNAQNIQ